MLQTAALCLVVSVSNRLKINTHFSAQQGLVVKRPFGNEQLLLQEISRRLLIQGTPKSNAGPLRPFTHSVLG